MAKDILDIAINTQTLEIYLDGVHFKPVQDEFTDVQGLRSDVWNLYHYLTDLRNELQSWRKFGSELHTWLDSSPREPIIASRRFRKAPEQ